MERFSIEDVVEGTEDRVCEDLSGDPVGQTPGVSCLDRADAESLLELRDDRLDDLASLLLSSGGGGSRPWFHVLSHGRLELDAEAPQPLPLL